MLIHQLRNGIFRAGRCGSKELKSALANKTIFEYSRVEKGQGDYSICDEIANPLRPQGLCRLCGGLIELIVVPPEGERCYNELFSDRSESFRSRFGGLERSDEIPKEVLAENLFYERACGCNSECWKIAWPGWKELPVSRMENR
jgi:hypothetical protein